MGSHHEENVMGKKGAKKNWNQHKELSFLTMFCLTIALCRWTFLWRNIAKDAADARLSAFPKVTALSHITSLSKFSFKILNKLQFQNVCLIVLTKIQPQKIDQSHCVLAKLLYIISHLYERQKCNSWCGFSRPWHGWNSERLGLTSLGGHQGQLGDQDDRGDHPWWCGEVWIVWTS